MSAPMPAADTAMRKRRMAAISATSVYSRVRFVTLAQRSAINGGLADSLATLRTSLDEDVSA